ncbi:hypothetical protein DFP72DRAFT_486231 [Ephemerocybe angulata]|uniref:Uncharacterized protein n=1 Tax=Ephemerocybe angulata TaxID=980116 RepID=A0A8H6MFE7_9AGAR|nr:hypothetical protein DFP72DRAFT_486231 [Tulosesus angulatus]
MGVTLPPGSGAKLGPGDDPYRMYYLVAFWLEAILFGIYSFLYAGTLYVFSQKTIRGNGAAIIISLGGNTVLFGLAVIHNSVNVYQMIHAYALQPDDAPSTAPNDFLSNYGNWDTFGQGIILSLIIWVGDLLGIYRCWVIWNRSYWVTIVPLILFTASVVLTSFAMYWWRDQDRISASIMGPIFKSISPVNIVLNCLTTGMIAYRIWRQREESRKAGLSVTSGMDLLTAVRIVIESALIYTLEMFLSIILFTVGHPSVLVVHHTLAPTIGRCLIVSIGPSSLKVYPAGIVFALIAIRSHVANHRTRSVHITSEIQSPWPQNSRLRASVDLNSLNENQAGTMRIRSFAVDDDEQWGGAIGKSIAEGQSMGRPLGVHSPN